ncbi:hypothetical protein BDN70DRAFT_901646 [Pholiota conissans]|uniref:Uncharacterized protein n=1 Tax=Pholiota conissans TaxID=109636 RepID=A0A9P5YLM4_9AGAR|nr:hypothetical protein BDN70DRAFT_901646 [Pholiota conissans]
MTEERSFTRNIRRIVDDDNDDGAVNLYTLGIASRGILILVSIIFMLGYEGYLLRLPRHHLLPCAAPTPATISITNVIVSIIGVTRVIKEVVEDYKSEFTSPLRTFATSQTFAFLSHLPQPSLGKERIPRFDREDCIARNKSKFIFLHRTFETSPTLSQVGFLRRSTSPFRGLGQEPTRIEPPRLSSLRVFPYFAMSDPNETAEILLRLRSLHARRQSRAKTIHTPSFIQNFIPKPRLLISLDKFHPKQLEETPISQHLEVRPRITVISTPFAGRGSDHFCGVLWHRRARTEEIWTSVDLETQSEGVGWEDDMYERYSSPMDPVPQALRFDDEEDAMQQHSESSIHAPYSHLPPHTHPSRDSGYLQENVDAYRSQNSNNCLYYIKTATYKDLLEGKTSNDPELRCALTSRTSLGPSNVSSSIASPTLLPKPQKVDHPDIKFFFEDAYKVQEAAKKAERQ